MFEGIKEFIKGKKPPLGEIATTESVLYRGLTYAQYNPDILTRKKGGLRIYDQMRIDDQVKNCLLLKKLATLAPGHTIEPAGDTPQEKEHAEFVEFALADMQGTVHGVLKKILTALDYGYSITEINWKIIESGDFKGKIGIESLKSKKPHFYKFDVDDFSNIKPNGLVQEIVTVGHGPDYLPINKFILYTYREEFSNWYGISDLREAYRSWWSKDNIIKFWNIFLERFGMPLAKGTFFGGSDTSAKDTLLTLLDNLQSKTSIVYQEGEYNIEFLEAMRKGGKDGYESAINYHNKGIGKAILIPDRLSAAGETGAYSQSQTHFEVFLWVVSELRTDLAEGPMDEQLIRRLIDWNYPDVVHLPKFKFNPLTDEQKMELVKLFSDAVQKGAVTVTPDDENHVRNTLGFPEVDEEELEKRRTEKEEQRKAESIERVKAAEAPPKGESKKPGEESEGKKVLSYTERPLTAYEDPVNFKQIETDLDKIEETALTDMKAVLTRQRDALVAFVTSKQLNNKLTTGLVTTGVNLKYGNELKHIVIDMYTQSYQQGIRDGRAELPSQFVRGKQGVKLPAKDALKYFEAKSDFVVRGIREPLITATQSTLLNAIRTGEAVPATVRKLQDAYIPYLAVGDVIVDDRQLTSFRLEAIVRTSQSEAYAQGRYAVGEDPALEGYVVGYMFSEILDDRTVEVSRFVDGKIISVTHPQAAELQYPLHWNERGMPVYVTQDDGPVSFMTDAEAATAVSMRGI